MTEPSENRSGDATRHLPAPQPPEPGLNIVSTPIGNLGDITLRALDALAGAHRIYAEDTRMARKLMDAFRLKGRVLTYHDHNGPAVRPEILAALAAGEAVVLISDAGTPLISDPGYKLVKEAVEAGHPVRALPGASALLTGLAAAGLPSDSFFFGGFLPPKTGARQNRLRDLIGVPGTLIFYETGPRLAASLKDLATVFRGRDVVVARELTKKFEEYRRGDVEELAQFYAENGAPKGEITMLIGPGRAEPIDEGEIEERLASLIPRLGVKGAASQLSDEHGLNRRELYQRAQSIKDAKR